MFGHQNAVSQGLKVIIRPVFEQWSHHGALRWIGVAVRRSAINSHSVPERRDLAVAEDARENCDSVAIVLTVGA